MREWIQSFATWFARRRRFAGEWTFHQTRAIADFRALGLTPREARRSARRRLGPKSLYRRRALREIGGDLTGLRDLLPLARLRRSPWIIPTCLALATMLALALNPQRLPLLHSLRATLPFTPPLHTVRLLPLTPPGEVPATFPAMVWRVALLFGAWRLFRDPFTRQYPRLRIYGAAGLALLAVFSMVFWLSITQLVLARAWSAGWMQALLLLPLIFGYTVASAAACNVWWWDVVRRCPRCGETLRMPLERGLPTNLLFDAAELESVCLRGHGIVTEGQWGRAFEPAHDLFSLT